MTTSKKRLLWQLFLSFLKIGPVTFGGGYAMIPLIEREVVQRHRWMAERDMHDLIAVSGSVPGAIAINSATFIGYRMAGAAGAFAATVGVMLPTFVIALLLSGLFLTFQHHPMVEAAFTSIRATIIALIAYAAYKFGRTAIVDKTTAVWIAVVLVLLIFMHVHPLIIIIGGFMFGITAVMIRGRLGMETRLKEEQKQEQSPDYFMGDGI